MKKLAFFILPLLIVTACVSRQCEKKDQRSVATSSSELSFEDMAKASSIIVQTFDHTSNLCGIPEEAIFMLPQKWQAVMDARFKDQKVQFGKMTAKERDAFGPLDCTKDCSCNVYVNFFDFLDQNGMPMTAAMQARYSSLSKAAAELKLNDPRCIEDGEWFCRSRILEKMLSD